MDRYTQMTVFVAVAEEAGFAPAARKLKISAPAATRAVAELETRLKTRLLKRTTRHVRMTDAGRRFLEDARKILADIAEAEDAAIGINAEPHGLLKVTAPVMFGRLHTLDGMKRFLQKYPGTTISALFVDRLVNLIEEDIDVGIRVGELQDSSLRALRVGAVRMVTCASPGYLDRHGTPDSPDRLSDHEIVATTAYSSNLIWQFANGRRIRIEPRVTFNDNAAAIEAVRSGCGLTRVLCYQVAPLLETGELKRVLVDDEPDYIPVSIVHRESRFGSAKIRSFVDLMAEQLRNDDRLNYRTATPT